MQPPLPDVVLRRELLAAGIDDRAIRRRLRSGDLRRVRHGAYVHGPSWPSDPRPQHQLRARAVLRQRATALVVSHISALVEWQVPLWDIDLGRVDVTRNDRRGGRHEAGIRQHYGVLRPHDITAVNDVPVTTPARTALDAITVLDVEHGLVVVNDLLHRGLVTHDELQVQSRAATGWPRSINKQIVLRLADGACESVGESRVLYACWRLGLPAPVPQFVVRDHNGRIVARVDFAWPDRGVFLEFDGRGKYDELAAAGESAADVVLREKRREDRIVEVTGWRCLRVTWGDLDRPEQLATRLRRLFAAQAAGDFSSTHG